MGLDGDAALTLEVHGVEHLLHHFALRERAGYLKQAIRKCGLPMVDMGDDREVPYVLGVHAVK